MISPITIIIIIFTCLVSYTSLNNRVQFEKLKHYPYQEKRAKEFYRMLSAGFVHGDFIHLAINMYVLYMFGGIVENAFEDVIYGKHVGKIVFLVMYLLNIVAASIPTYFKHKNNASFASVGASGAVSGLVFIYIVLMPYAPLQFLFLPFIDIPAILLGVGYLIYSSYAAKKAKTRIDHVAHFYGALFGIAFLWISKPEYISHFFNTLVNKFPF